jgi:hypothetical protein
MLQNTLHWINVRPIKEVRYNLFQRVLLTQYLAKCADYCTECQPVVGFGSEGLASSVFAVPM